MTFDVRSTGSPVTALFTCKGSARIDGAPVTFEMQGYHTFYSVRDPIAIKAPIK